MVFRTQELYADIADDETGMFELLDLITRGEQWIHRRVDSIAFQDNVTVEWRSSIDFTVPTTAPTLNSGNGSADETLVPLSMLAKQPLTGFDVTDEAGRSLPVLTAEQNATLSVGILHAWSRAILEMDPSEDLLALFSRAVRCHESEGSQLYGEFEEAASVKNKPDFQSLREAAEGSFAAFLADLSEHFILFVVLNAPQRERRIVKLASDQEFLVGEHSSRSSRVLERLGWAPSSTEFELTTPILPSSQHFEVTKPIQVDVVRLTTEFDPPRSNPSGQDLAGGGQHVHVHCGQLREGEALRVRVDLMAERQGWLHSSWVAAVGITVMLAFLGWNLTDLWGQVDEAPGRVTGWGASLLLAVAGLSGSLLSRADEHALATELLSALRKLAVVPPACAFALAAALTVDVETLREAWIVLAAAGVAAIAITFAARPRRGGS